MLSVCLFGVGRLQFKRSRNHGLWLFCDAPIRLENRSWLARRYHNIQCSSLLVVHDLEHDAHLRVLEVKSVCVCACVCVCAHACVSVNVCGLRMFALWVFECWCDCVFVCGMWLRVFMCVCMCVFACVCVCVCVCLRVSVWLCLCLCSYVFCLVVLCLCLCLCLCFCLSLCGHASVSEAVSVSAYVSLSAVVFLFAVVSVAVSVSACLSMSVCCVLFVCLSGWAFFCSFMCLFVCVCVFVRCVCVCVYRKFCGEFLVVMIVSRTCMLAPLSPKMCVPAFVRVSVQMSALTRIIVLLLISCWSRNGFAADHFCCLSCCVPRGAVVKQFVLHLFTVVSLLSVFCTL